MKWLAFLLIVSLFISFGFPCADRADEQNGVTTWVITQADEHGEACGDECLALCPCSCCGIAISAPPSCSYTIPYTLPSYYCKDYFYYPLYSNAFLPKVWQPPMVG